MPWSAWCWFKLKPLLEAAGHRVSAFDLSASGTNTKVIQDVATLADYSMPLLEFMATIPPEKKVVLVGHSLGAWCWFKLKPLLEAAGHRVSAFDLSASGTNTKVIQDVATLADYSMPLLEFMATIPPEKKVVLVGHSLGGMNLALAMEKFPEKISISVFLTAFMPDTVHTPSYVIDQYNKVIKL
ncbi:unnamed protein product [Lactuca virosa]|uniref:AB hydrolase-1 domain-containing protein n=1 Tax=Lactuca virosa TaxID=75947 RepID=A0AAU9NN10_9ASTR|nr:unnamed protein product [Lactuca virosa]